jgi:effector-binding domain-containing protein
MKKFLKRTGIVLLVLVLIWTITALFSSPTCHVERTMAINAPAGVVFDQINTLQNWKKWSYWDNIDKISMHDSFAGPESGIGNKHFWNSPNDSVGKGSLTITRSEPNKFVETELAFDKMGTSMGGWKINDSAGTVYVTTYMDMKPPFFMRPMMLFMNVDKMLGPDFDKSLDGLKKVSEAAASLSASSTAKIEQTTVPSMEIMSIMDSCTSSNISQKLGQLYMEIGVETQKQGLKQAGPVFAVYHKVIMNADGSKNFVLQAGIPVDKPGKSAGRVKAWTVPAGNVVKASYYGPYDKVEPTYMALQEWMSKNGKTADGPPWESYVTDPGKEPDSTKWLTEIYYAIK